ncbi:ATP-dependent helicase (plasmid) [Polaromonas sp. P1-6]|nr:ATP-dependent helicase [Polaromonas sp. P1-6]
MQSHFLDDLNADQRQAASCLHHCLTIAAPGSGKTKMLSAKAAFLLSGGASVVAVTFTRDSALELRERIVKQAGAESLTRLLVGTFHSIDLLMAFPAKARSAMGSEILKHSRSSLKAPWNIVKEGTRRGAVARAIDASGLAGLELDQATSLIEAIKSGHKSADNEMEAALVETYTDVLNRHGVIDFQDILLKTNEGMASGHITPLKTNYLLLDEFQDTDLPQFAWAMAHAQAGTSVTAVGDDDQSIYGFRRALGFAGMQDFADKLSATRVVLGLNYRSHAEVLTPSSRLIAGNLDRMDKALVSNKGMGGQSYWEKFADRVLEAEACVQKTQESLKAGQSVGVLARTNKRLDEVEAQMIKDQIPYSRAGGDSLLKTREMMVLVSTLGCLVRDDPKDVDELLAWCGVDEDDLAALHKAFGNGVFAAERNRAALGKASVKDATKSLVTKLGKRFSEWRSFVATDGVAFVMGQVVPMLKDHTAEKRSQKLLDVVSEVVMRPVNKQSAVSGNPTKDFADRLQQIRDAMSGRANSDKEEFKPVSLMTAHSSKGLEFDMVWVLGAEEEAFPDKDSGLQEERRLFYVAMTRARKHLWISMSGKPAPSRFVFEAKLDRVPENTFKTNRN